MQQQELFICSGSLIPEDHELGLTTGWQTCGDWDMLVEIKCSRVMVSLKAPRAHEGVFLRVRNGTVMRTAQYFADMWLPIVSFGEGASYATRIIEMENADGYVKRFGPGHRYGDGPDDHFSVEGYLSHVGSYADLIAEDVWFGRAMQDYANALHISEDTPFYCYRALETLMHHYCRKCRNGEDCKNCSNWYEMHAELGTSRCAIEKIKPYADKRHGRPFSMSDFEELETKGGNVSMLEMLKDVRDTLQAFVIKHKPWSGCDGELPKLDCTRIPKRIAPNGVRST